MAPLDPIRYLPDLKTPILLQFAEDDVHLPRARVGTLATVASEPKEARFYSAGHELNQQATQQRIAWLRRS